MQRSSRTVLAIAGIIILGLVLLRLLFPPPISDLDQISDQITTAATAIEGHNVSKAMSVVSDHFTDTDGHNVDQLRLILSHVLRNAGKIQVHVLDPLTTLSPSHTDAATTCTVEVTGDSTGNAINDRVNIHIAWKKELANRLLIIPTHEWRITSVDQSISMEY